MFHRSWTYCGFGKTSCARVAPSRPGLESFCSHPTRRLGGFPGYPHFENLHRKCTGNAQFSAVADVDHRVIRASRPPAKSDRSLLNRSHPFHAVIANQRSAKKRAVSKLKRGPKIVRKKSDFVSVCSLSEERACRFILQFCILNFVFSSRAHFCTIFANFDASLSVRVIPQSIHPPVPPIGSIPCSIPLS
jgi:hypothetical protein